MIAKKGLFMILIGKDVQMSTSVRARTVFASKNVQILKVYFLKNYCRIKIALLVNWDNFLIIDQEASIASAKQATNKARGTRHATTSTSAIKWLIKQRAALIVFARTLLAAFLALAKKVKQKLKMQRLLWTSKQNHFVVSKYRRFSEKSFLNFSASKIKKRDERILRKCLLFAELLQLLSKTLNFQVLCSKTETAKAAELTNVFWAHILAT